LVKRMRKQRLLIPVLILVAAGLAAFGGRAMASYVPAPPAAPPSAAAQLETAWQNAKAAGRYRYGAESLIFNDGALRTRD
jgi:hypothetical protein